MTVQNPSAGGDRVRDGLCTVGDLAACISAGAEVANHVMANRITVPTTGTLHDVAVFVGNQAGNCIAAVYDTGNALAGSRTKLWDSGSVAVGAPGWQVVGDPALAVVAGQQLDLAFMADGAVATFLHWPNLGNVSAMNVLPTNFLPAAGGASPKMTWDRNAGAFAMPATITEAQCAAIGAGFAPCIIARVA